MCAKAPVAARRGHALLLWGLCFVVAAFLVALSCAPSRPSDKSIALSAPAREWPPANSAQAGNRGLQSAQPVPGQPAPHPANTDLQGANPPPNSVTLARQVVELKLVHALPIDRFDNFQP